MRRSRYTVPHYGKITFSSAAVQNFFWLALMLSETSCVKQYSLHLLES